MTPEATTQIESWGLTEAIAYQVGIFETANARLLYPEMPERAALVIPYFDPQTGALRTFERTGAPMPYARLRWLSVPPPLPFTKNKPQRYMQPARSGVAAYFPPSFDWPKIMADPSAPIILTEGEAKALAACSLGFNAIAFGGVYSFRDKAGALLPELAAINWAGRDVFICYDSDAASNPAVMAAEASLAEALQRQRGAAVRIVRLPSAEEKVGLDDYLRLEGPDAFERLAFSSPSMSALDLKVLELNKTCAWIECSGDIWDIEQRASIGKGAFTEGSIRSTAVHYVQTGKGVKEINVAKAWLRHPYAQRYTDKVLRPDQGRVVTGAGGVQWLNLWEGYEAEPGPVEPFMELTRHILRNLRPEDADLPLKLLAYKAQNPAEKIPLALVFIGTQGSGKSLWQEILIEAFGRHGTTVGMTQVASRFMGWMEWAVLIQVDEVDAELFQQNIERIRGLISQLTTPMEVKFRDVKTVNFYGLFMFNSNKRAVGSFAGDDRRMIVIDTPEKREPEFYDRIKTWRRAGGAKALMHWLLSVDLGKWRPPSQAPRTDEKILAYHEGLTPVQMLADQMRTSDHNMIIQWTQAAEAWAMRMEMSNNNQLAAHATLLLTNVNDLQIRPWYTAQELTMLFPSVIEQLQGSRFNKFTPAGQISRELREAGIPFLRCADNPAGFLHRGVLKQYLIVSSFDEWSSPLSQANFERLIGQFPTYGQLKRRR